MDQQVKDSLVKYDSPVLVQEKPQVNGTANGAPPSTAADPKKKNKRLTSTTTSTSKLPPVAEQSKVASQVEVILNSIVPPREWNQDGKLWVQSVSSTPATRLDVIALQEQLDQKLVQRKARETGICPVRQELYSQCFGKPKKLMCKYTELQPKRSTNFLIQMN
jgi:dynein light intermediate chain